MNLKTLMILTSIIPSAASAADVAIGDSIALGTGHAMHIATVARSGAGSCEILKWIPHRGSYTHAVVSAGINDDGMCVASIRLNLRAKHVTWIIPAAINPGAAAVRAVIAQYGDSGIPYACKGPCTRVNFHPASYGVVAKAVHRDWYQH